MCDRHPGPDDILLLIEISQSTQAYDLGDKQKAYAAAGIQEYWVVDLKAKQMTVFRQPARTSYLSRLEMRMGAIAPLAFPAVKMSIEKVLITNLSC